MNVPWSQSTATAIGVEWLLAAIAPASAFGRRARANERAHRFGDEVAARARIARVCAVARAIEPPRLAAIVGTIARAPEIGSAIELASAGVTLSDTDFFECCRFLDAAADVASQARGLESFDAIDGGDAVRIALSPGLSSGSTFYLVDAFDDVLAQARARSEVARAALDLARTRARRDVAAALGLEDVHPGEFTLARDRASDLPASVRIVREGATYVLCRLEPGPGELFALAACDAAADAVAEREEVVRERLSAVIADAAIELHAASAALGELDSLVARAAFAQRYACVEPEICEEATASLGDVRYLPLDEELRRSGRCYAPISFALAGVAVVTGPNMGGKTAALRALGFAVACVALGVPVPAASARLPLVDRIAWLGVEDVPNGTLLSSFAREVVGLRDLLAAPDARQLVLVDEFARTTSPREGRAMTVALVRTFVARRAIGLVATHFADVARDARTTHFSSGHLGAFTTWASDDSLEVALARFSDAMQYGLVQVAAHDVPPADALALAEALGLEATLVAEARAML